MVKKRRGRKEIITSHQRAHEAIAQARVVGTQKEIVLDEVELIEDKVCELSEGKEVVIEESSEMIKEKFRLKSEKAHEQAKELQSDVYRLFELTRDGERTPQNYHDELVNDPEISGDDVYRAISFGIEASSHQFLSKER